MSEDRTLKIWILLLLFLVVFGALFIIGVAAIFRPSTIVSYAYEITISGNSIAQILNNIPIINNIFGLDWITKQPLLNTLPYVGALTFLISLVVLIDLYGLWTFKKWAWSLSILISLILSIVIVGIICLYILFKEDTKIAYNQS